MRRFSHQTLDLFGIIYDIGSLVCTYQGRKNRQGKSGESIRKDSVFRADGRVEVPGDEAQVLFIGSIIRLGSKGKKGRVSQALGRPLRVNR